MRSLDDTIVAIATPRGVGAIAVVRLSGRKAREIAGRLTRGGGADWRPNVARVRRIFPVSGEEPLDECVVTFFESPRSYTGEDLVEISCHGGPYVVHRIVEECIKAGARLAEPGEFTRRAVLNGKMDLTQAEAVLEIVRARSEASLLAAVRQYEGSLARRLRAVREELVELAARIELELDFAEEDVTFASREELLSRIDRALCEVRDAVNSYRRGRRMVEGVRAVLVGRPNVGKSSLLNALLEAERAIVTEVPGTTRDTIEDDIVLGGILFRLVDTAGLRRSEDHVEVLGIDRTWREVERADVVLWIVDGSLKEDEALGEEAGELLRRLERTGADLVVVVNKVDLPRLLSRRAIEKVAGGVSVVEVSAKTGVGLQELEETLVQLVTEDDEKRGNEWEDSPLTTERQFQAMVRCEEALRRCRESTAAGLGSELIAVDLREAIDAIGSVTGEVTTDEILNGIFANFCIGK